MSQVRTVIDLSRRLYAALVKMQLAGRDLDAQALSNRFWYWVAGGRGVWHDRPGCWPYVRKEG